MWQQCCSVCCSPYRVSIHTPTQGVTVSLSKLIPSLKFQSTHPRRVWHSKQYCYREVLQFQSTHPRRVWHCCIRYGASLACFNPHTHAGCDEAIHYSWIVMVEFQSTHPRRVWPIASVIAVMVSMFQSTHPRRVWLGIIVWCCLVACFNPHTHAGCDSISNNIL